MANRFDYQLSEKHRFFGRWSWLKYREDRQDWTYETARGLMTNGVNRNNARRRPPAGSTRPAPSTVFDVDAGGNNIPEGNILTPTALGFTPSTVGLPAYMDAKAGSNHALPIMSFSGYDTLGQSVPAWTHFEMLLDQSERIAHSRRAHRCALASTSATTGGAAATRAPPRARSRSPTPSPAAKTTA